MTSEIPNFCIEKMLSWLSSPLPPSRLENYTALAASSSLCPFVFLSWLLGVAETMILWPCLP